MHHLVARLEARLVVPPPIEGESTGHKDCSVVHQRGRFGQQSRCYGFHVQGMCSIRLHDQQVIDLVTGYHGTVDEPPLHGRRCLLALFHMSFSATRTTKNLADFNQEVTLQAGAFRNSVQEAGWCDFDLLCIEDTDQRSWVVVDVQTSLMWLMLFANPGTIQRAFDDVCQCLSADKESAKNDLALAEQVTIYSSDPFDINHARVANKALCCAVWV